MNEIVRRFFFISWFTDPSTQIFAFKKKIKILFLTFFLYFLRCKKLPDLKKKKIKYSKNNKNCMILHCKNAEMTILLSFLHFYSVKSYNFVIFFSPTQI